MTTPRVVFACVSEATPAWVAKAENLVLSIRRFGGRLAGAPVVTSFVDEAPADVSRLEALGATIKVVPRHDLFGVYKAANKLRLFEDLDVDALDVLVAIDCDVIVKGDLTPGLDLEAVRAVPATMHHFRDDQWAFIYESLELPAPSARMTSLGYREEGYPYLNGGMLMIPARHVPTLATAWPASVRALLDLNERSGGRIKERVAADQPGLICALTAAGIPWRTLPANFNWPTPRSWLSREYATESGPPWVFHYHHRIDPEGFLLATIHPKVNAELDEFNRARAEAFSVPYDGLTPLGLRKRLDGQLARIGAYSALRHRSLDRRTGTGRST